MNGGAVAYLTHSPYGRNGNEITINNSGVATGNAGDSVSAGKVQSTSNAYNTTAGMLASTTGNITGIYDMSGGTWEYVAAWDKNSTSNYISSHGSSFASRGGSSTKYATAYNGNSDVLPSSSNCMVGDATYEVGNITGEVNNYAWFDDYFLCAISSKPFFMRGGNYDKEVAAGVFCSYHDRGYDHNEHSFRVCLPGN